MSDCLSVGLSICMSICLSVGLSVFLSVCWSVCLSVCRSVCRAVCLSVFLYVNERNLLISGIGPGVAVVTGAAVVGAVTITRKKNRQIITASTAFAKSANILADIKGFVKNECHNKVFSI